MEINFVRIAQTSRQLPPPSKTYYSKVDALHPFVIEGSFTSEWAMLELFSQEDAGENPVTFVRVTLGEAVEQEFLSGDPYGRWFDTYIANSLLSRISDKMFRQEAERLIASVDASNEWSYLIDVPAWQKSLEPAPIEDSADEPEPAFE